MKLQCIESISKIFFYVAGPSAAWFALFTWKRELKGKSKHATAKSILSFIARIKGKINSTHLRVAFISRIESKRECYRWVAKDCVIASDLAVDTMVNWGEKEAQLIYEISQILFELDFVVSSYDPSDLIGEQIGVNKELVMNYGKIVDGIDKKYYREFNERLDNIENRFRRYVQ